MHGSYDAWEGSSLPSTIYIYCKSTRMSSRYGLKGDLQYNSAGHFISRIGKVQTEKMKSAHQVMS